MAWLNILGLPVTEDFVEYICLFGEFMNANRKTLFCGRIAVSVAESANAPPWC